MGLFGQRLAGAGYVVLNIIRVMNIISLLAVIAASASMLVKTFNTQTFFFFEGCEHVVRSAICGFLILTELPLFKYYWIRKWPLFSQTSGFVMLGTSMLLIGNSMLANLNKSNASQESLGMPFWRLVISSGIVIVVMGSVNILASYVFRDTKQGLTARQVRSDGATASHKANVESTIAASTPKPDRRSRYRSFFLRADKENRTSLPSYHANTTFTQPPAPQSTTMSPYTTTGSPYSSKASNSEQRFPVSPSSKYSCDSPPPSSVRRPDLVHHPAMNGRPF